jgi:RNA polymerase sigma-70 factor (ECF subfamily)
MSDTPTRLGLDDLPRVYQQHGPMVLRRAQRLLGSLADAEEAMQEIFIRAFRSVDRFDARSSIATWLYSITTNYCLNLLRDRARRRQLDEEHLAGDADAAAGGASLIQPAQRVLLRNLLATADEDDAQAAVCVYLEGMSQAEAAEVLGVSQRTVGNRLERFLAFAKRHLASSTQLPAAGASSTDGLPRRRVPS